MKQLAKRIGMLAAVFCAGLQAGQVTLDPFDGALSGGPGQTVGWGFTLQNSTDYLLVTAADYITTTPVGTFTDFISGFNFVVVGPSPENVLVSHAFDGAAFTGVGSYRIDGAAPVGALSTGFIQIGYDLYTVSPNDPGFDPGVDFLSSGTLTAPATIQVTGQAAGVPEPSSWVLLALGAAVLPLVRKRERR